MKKKRYFESLFLITLGAFTSLSLPPYNFLLLNFLTFSLFFIYIYKKKESSKKHKGFLYGWFFGFGYFLTNIYWITISLTFDQNFVFLIPLAAILIPAFLAIFYGFASYCFFQISIKKPLSNLLLFSLLFGTAEFIRGNILTGFPWNLIAYSFSNNLEIIQVISIIGVYAFNVLCISFFSIPSIFILRKDKKEIVACIFLLLSPIFLFVNGSSKIKSFQSLDVVKNDYLIRTIGSKIALNRFNDSSDPINVINELIDLSEPDKSIKTLFIWPEGIIPNTNQLDLKQYEIFFNRRFNEKHLLGFGIVSHKNIDDKDLFYNSFSFYDHNLNLVENYDKINLVPFGEFLPFEKVLSKLGLKSLTNNYQSFSRGKDREVIKINEDHFNLKILPLICYEIIYSGKIFEDPEFDFIINISEDGWFGDSIGPHQHFVHSIFRSIESGKYLIRSANNGIAAIINPIGFVEKKIPFGNSGYIDFSEKRVSIDTVFSQQGNKMFLLIILLYIFLIFSFNRIS